MSEEVTEVVETPSESTAAQLADRQGDVAADYLEGLLDILDLDGDIEIEIKGDRALVSIVEAKPGDLANLVGEEGEVLAALQDLTRLAVTNETDARARILLDIAGFREQKRDEIRKIGQVAIAEVQETGEPVRMAAMSAFERKVIHDAVAEAGLTSESEGTEPQRYVVIKP